MQKEKCCFPQTTASITVIYMDIQCLDDIFARSHMQRSRSHQETDGHAALK